jgi:hypothetical protein
VGDGTPTTATDTVSDWAVLIVLLEGVTVTAGVVGEVAVPAGMTDSDTGMLTEDPLPVRAIVPLYNPIASPVGLTDTLMLPGAAPLVDEMASHEGPLVLALHVRADWSALPMESVCGATVVSPTVQRN